MVDLCNSEMQRLVYVGLPTRQSEKPHRRFKNLSLENIIAKCAQFIMTVRIGNFLLHLSTLFSAASAQGLESCKCVSAFIIHSVTH